MPEGEGKSESETFGALVGYTITMKRFLFVILQFLPVVSIATPVDSMIGPFRSPLVIKITVHGIFEETNDQMGNSTRQDQFGPNVTIYASDTSAYMIRGDTIFIPSCCVGRFIPTVPLSYIVFDTLTRSMPSIFFIYDYSDDYYHWTYGTWYVSLKSFLYDSVSIYSADSDLSSHLVYASYTSHSESHPFHNPIIDVRLDSVLGLDVSGTFARRSYFASVEYGNQESDISIRRIRGYLEATCGPSSHPRTLEIYSQLGVKAASYPIAPGQTSEAIAKLPSGLYFIRLEGALLKVYVPE